MLGYIISAIIGGLLLNAIDDKREREREREMLQLNYENEKKDG